MGDIYSLDKAISKQKKDKNKVSDDLIAEAERIEEENYETAKDVRMELAAASIEQKAATEEMKRQGETLDSAKKSAAGVHREARKGEDITDDIEREGRLFSCGFACWHKFKRWFKRDSADKEAEEIAAKDTSYKGYTRTVEKEKFEEDDQEYIPGQNKTDKELVDILNTVKGIRSEAEIQGEEAERQKVVVKDISAINEQSEKVIKRTDKHLKDL